jgi:F-type H+-transporting ATPase subunit b
MNIGLTLVSQAVAFFLFVWFAAKFVWPPLMGAIEARQKQVAEGLASAEKGRVELLNAAKRSEEELKGARDQAQQIIAQAEKRASEIIDEAKAQARTEAERLVTGAQAEIDQTVSQARESLRDQVAGLAVAGAEKILRREVNQAAHAELLAQLRAEL